MPRKPFECCPQDPYHVAARSHNRIRFPTPIELTWEIMSYYLGYISHDFNVKIHSFVLMPNHFHLCASFPEANFSPAMRYFMRETSRAMSKHTNCINQKFGARCFRSQIRFYNHFLNVYKYVYRNPLRAKLCDRAEDYKFSSLNRILGGEKLTFPVVEDTILFDGSGFAPTLKWINSVVKVEHTEAIRKALKHRIFKLALVKNQPHELESSLY